MKTIKKKKRPRQSRFPTEWLTASAGGIPENLADNQQKGIVLDY